MNALTVKELYTLEEKRSGSQSQLKLRLPHVLMVRRSSGKKRKCVIVRL